MTHSQVPYVPGPSTAPISPPVPPPTPAPAGPVVMGASVDLAHELAELRRLHYANLLLTGLTALFALLAAGLAGYTAYYVYSFVDALQKAFGD